MKRPKGLRPPVQNVGDARVQRGASPELSEPKALSVIKESPPRLSRSNSTSSNKARSKKYKAKKSDRESSGSGTSSEREGVAQLQQKVCLRARTHV